MVATDIVTIAGTLDSNYDNSHPITNVAAVDNFDVTATWGATATGTWYEADCVDGLRVLLVNNKFDVLHTGVCDDDGTEAGVRCEGDGDCGGGTCALPNKSRGIKMEGDVRVVSSNNYWGAHIESTADNYAGSFTHYFTNDFFEGPGVSTGGTYMFDLNAPGETYHIDGALVGTDWPNTSNHAFIFWANGNVYGDVAFQGDTNFWEPGGKARPYSVQNIVRSADGETGLGEIQLKVSGPPGSSPSNLAHEDLLLAADDSDINGFIDGGPEIGRIDFSEGQTVGPPGCNYRLSCADVTLNNAATEYLQLDDCTIDGLEANSEGALEALDDIPTRVCGFRAEIDETPGGGGALWRFTVRAGPTGNLDDTDATCDITAGMQLSCIAGNGLLAALDEVTLSVVPVTGPDCTAAGVAGCEGSFSFYFDSPLE
jgi:hypothetical protein